MKQIIKQLKDHVEKEGLRETARQLGISASAVHKYINGQRFPSGKILIKLMDKFG